MTIRENSRIDAMQTVSAEPTQAAETAAGSHNRVYLPFYRIRRKRGDRKLVCPGLWPQVDLIADLSLVPVAYRWSSAFLRFFTSRSATLRGPARRIDPNSRLRSPASEDHNTRVPVRSVNDTAPVAVSCRPR